MPKGRLLDPGRKSRQGIRASRRQEKEAAERLGGSVTPGSGNQWHSKGDVQAERWLVEAKTTEKDQYPLKREVLRKLKVEAVLAGKKPALEIEFSSRQRETWVVLPLSVAEELGYGD